MARPELAPPEPGASTASVLVAAPPERVFDAVANPLRWGGVFTDAVKVEPRGKDTWRVTSTMLGSAVDLSVQAVRPSLIKLQLIDGGPGAELAIDVRLEPTASGSSTRVVYRMATALPMGLSYMFDDDSLREGRERKVLADVADLERAFGSAG